MLKQYKFKKLCLRKKLDKLPTHPNNYTDSKFFWENLTQYRITPLIGTLHYSLKANSEDEFPADDFPTEDKS
jgi:hypothetical protein